MQASAARFFISVIISFALSSCNRDDLAVVVDPPGTTLSSSTDSITVQVGIHTVVTISGGSSHYTIKHLPDDLLARAILQSDTLVVYGLDTGATSVVVADSLDENNTVQVGIVVAPSHGWQPLGSGVNGFVEAISISGSDVYAVGFFSSADNVQAQAIARWDGARWHDVGGGLSGYGLAVTASGADVYVGGIFPAAGGVPANNIARWNGGHWASLGEGVRGEVHAVLVSGSEVYAGGIFDSAGGVFSHAVAKWNGNQWVSLAGGIVSPFPDKTPMVTSLMNVGSLIYAGGIYSDLSPCGGPGFVSVWDGSSWQELGTTACGGSLGPAIAGLVSSNGQLIAGGVFSSVNGVSISCLARWDGSLWNALGSGLQTHVYAIAANATEVYAGGFVFSTGGDGPYVARWNGTSWNLMAGEFNGAVWSLGARNDALYAGGNFTSVGTQPMSYIAVWRP